jgi:hypothetical protein
MTYDLIGSIIGLAIIIGFATPFIIVFSLMFKLKIDNDGDGKDDIQYRWQK